MQPQAWLISFYPDEQAMFGGGEGTLPLLSHDGDGEELAAEDGHRMGLEPIL